MQVKCKSIGLAIATIGLVLVLLSSPVLGQAEYCD